MYDSDDFSWGLAGLAGATSVPHVDTDGLATAVVPLSGSKYWVLLRRKTGGEGLEGMNSVNSLLHIDPYEPVPSTSYEAEGIFLEPGSVL